MRTEQSSRYRKNGKRPSRSKPPYRRRSSRGPKNKDRVEEYSQPAESPPDFIGADDIVLAGGIVYGWS